MSRGLLDRLYEVDARDADIFGKAYLPPAKQFTHAEWTTVARFKKVRGSDGQPVEIDECRLPARFFRLRALASKNSVGRPVPAFTLTTGSGDEVGKLMVALAKEITEGMVGIEREGS